MVPKAGGYAFIAKGLLGQRPKISRGLPVGSIVKCVDNTGAMHAITEKGLKIYEAYKIIESL